jgi:sensor histidine kinase YesM
MMITRKAIIKHILLPIGVGIAIGCLLTVFFNWQNIFSWQAFLEQSLYSVILTFLFWKGNTTIIKLLTKKFSWLENTRKRVIIHIILAVVYSMLVIHLFYFYIWFLILHKPNFNFSGFYQHFNVGIYICFSINLIFILGSYSGHFLKFWKTSVINEERLKRESLALQYESLKNQVNPHFLFNSLNILTSLIEHDRDASVNYVKQLSDVLRYVLEQNVNELVSISTEMKFIESYIFLQQIRFGENLKTSIKIEEEDFLVVPLALQILIENAIKHNEISAEKPLNIQIHDDGEYLVVENNVQPRNYLPESNQLGLKTLEFLYGFLSGKRMEVNCENGKFIVMLPKIKNTDHASTGN